MDKDGIEYFDPLFCDEIESNALMMMIEEAEEEALSVLKAEIQSRALLEQELLIEKQRVEMGAKNMMTEEQFMDIERKHQAELLQLQQLHQAKLDKALIEEKEMMKKVIISKNLKEISADTNVDQTTYTKDLKIQSYYHSSINREEAERLLKNSGDFLIRKCTKNQNQYILSAQVKDKYVHVRLVNEDLQVEINEESFSNIKSFIDYYHGNAKILRTSKNTMVLRTPVRRGGGGGGSSAYHNGNSYRSLRKSKNPDFRRKDSRKQ